MARLTLPEWAHIAEIIGSIVIVLSLVYVAFELGHNTNSLQQSSYQAALETLATGDMMLAENADMHQLVKSAETDPNSISDTEWSRFKHYTMPRIGVWEYSFLGYEAGAIADEHWLAMDGYFGSIYCQPGYERFFSEASIAFAPDFLDYIEHRVKPRCQ